MRSGNGELVDTPYHEQHKRDQSALAQFRSFSDYPHFTWLSLLYERIHIYETWESGRGTSLRRAQPADSRGNVLVEDCSNLGLFLNQTLGTAPAYKRQVVEGMSELYPRFTNYEVVVNSGSVQIFFTEEDTSIPATRLSDGALRYLCLLAILYNPKPPPVVCIEEPELGLHPDIVGGLAKHLRAASERMQLIVTTHSDILIDALSDTPGVRRRVREPRRRDADEPIGRRRAERVAGGVPAWPALDAWTDRGHALVSVTVYVEGRRRQG